MCDYDFSDEDYEIMMNWTWNDHDDEDYEDGEFDYDNGFDMADEV